VTQRKAPRESTCHVLLEDPALGQGISSGQRTRAEETCVASALNVRRGRWEVPEGDVCDGIGLLVLDGLLLRRVSVEGRFSAELLGAGDVIRPWQELAEPALRPYTTWRALKLTRLAVLDDHAVERMADYPEIIRGLIERSVERSRRLAVNMAIVHHPRIDIRLRMLFWHLADRWGRVRGGETVLPLRLTHSVLADLVAAQRPTVSSALSELACRDILRPTPYGWLLLGPPPVELVEWGRRPRSAPSAS
jgi:CRP/FNR family transcriptional regulator, cyclic AMP receptor protein